MRRNNDDLFPARLKLTPYITIEIYRYIYATLRLFLRGARTKVIKNNPHLHGYPPAMSWGNVIMGIDTLKFTVSLLLNPVESTELWEQYQGTGVISQTLGSISKDSQNGFRAHSLSTLMLTERGSSWRRKKSPVWRKEPEGNGDFEMFVTSYPVKKFSMNAPVTSGFVFFSIDASNPVPTV